MENWKQKPLSQVVSRWIRGTTLNRSRADYYTKTPQPGKPSMGKSWGHKEEYISQTENYLAKKEQTDPVAGSAKRALCYFRIRNYWKKCYCRL